MDLNAQNEEIDIFLQKFDYNTLKGSIDGLTEKDYLKLINAEQTTDIYNIGGMEGRLKLQVDGETHQHSVYVYQVEKFKELPEIVNNRILNATHINQLNMGKKVLIDNDILHYNKEKTFILKEKLSNYSLPEAIGKEKISNMQKCRLINGEEIVTGNNIKVSYQINENICVIGSLPKGLNKQQKESIENYTAKFMFSNPKEREKLNHGLINKYKNELKPEILKELESSHNKTKDLSSLIKEQLVLKNNETKPSIKVISKDKKTKSIMDQAKNKKMMAEKLGLINGSKRAVEKTKGLVNQMTQSM